MQTEVAPENGLDSTVIGVFLQKSTTAFTLSKRQVSGGLTYSLDLHTTPEWAEDPSVLSVDVETKLEIFVVGDSPDSKPKSGDRPIGTVEVTYQAQIAIAEHHKHFMDVDRAEGFARTQGISMVYPYIRQYLSDTIVRAGFPPLYIPLLEQAEKGE
ncbi:protein-export chaperone SecB [Nesterenkonia sp. AY15]|uniref:protein-export chaperone SecB n=1 Tax=Nesterenkonia sp. AY15 TaxID=2901139 RepID=UPI001F4CA940|nr:protein-export chaperone SecB [Nesterenkonia sp. AY15]MCH8570333.1 protein-export chaperone SecB [Nesterenkonia sp. AY15]